MFQRPSWFAHSLVLRPSWASEPNSPYTSTEKSMFFHSALICRPPTQSGRVVPRIVRSLPSILPLPSRVGDLDLAGFLSVDRSQVGFVFLPDAYLFVIIVYAVDRIAYEQAVVDVFLHLGILQAYQLLLVAVIREVHPQVEVLRFHGDGREAYLPAAVAVSPMFVHARLKPEV